MNSKKRRNNSESLVLFHPSLIPNKKTDIKIENHQFQLKNGTVQEVSYINEDSTKELQDFQLQHQSRWISFCFNSKKFKEATKKAKQQHQLSSMANSTFPLKKKYIHHFYYQKLTPSSTCMISNCSNPIYFLCFICKSFYHIQYRIHHYESQCFFNDSVKLKLEEKKKITEDLQTGISIPPFALIPLQNTSQTILNIPEDEMIDITIHSNDDDDDDDDDGDNDHDDDDDDDDYVDPDYQSISDDFDPPFLSIQSSPQPPLKKRKLSNQSPPTPALRSLHPVAPSSTVSQKLFPSKAFKEKLFPTLNNSFTNTTINAGIFISARKNVAPLTTQVTPPLPDPSPPSSLPSPPSPPSVPKKKSVAMAQPVRVTPPPPPSSDPDSLLAILLQIKQELFDLTRDSFELKSAVSDLHQDFQNLSSSSHNTLYSLIIDHHRQFLNWKEKFSSSLLSKLNLINDISLNIEDSCSILLTRPPSLPPSSPPPYPGSPPYNPTTPEHLKNRFFFCFLSSFFLSHSLLLVSPPVYSPSAPNSSSIIIKDILPGEESDFPDEPDDTSSE